MVSVVCAALLCASLARADVPAHEALEADRLYQSGQYAASVAAYERLYRRDPRPSYLYAWAQAARMAGDCDAAVGLYKKFIQGDPPAAHAAAARMNMARCIEREPEVQVKAAPIPQALKPSPWYRDKIGAALGASGIGVLAIGVGFYAASSPEAQSAQDAITYAAHEDALDRAERYRTVGIVGLSIGSALVISGVIRYAIVAAKGRGLR